MAGSVNSVRVVALRLLATREHSTIELKRKLSKRGFDEEDIQFVIDECTQKKFLSDERFTNAYIHSRRERGVGPVRIQKELQEHQIDVDLIAEYLRFRDSVWFEKAVAVREKKFGRYIPDDYKEKMRQSRYLEYRGFSHDQIQQAFRQDDMVTS